MEEQEIPNSVVVRRLTKSYGGVKAIDGVSFRIGKGEIVGFLGPNGAGKSTTMKILAGMTQADSGSALICGESVARQPDKAREHIGFMPENNPLPEDLRVIEYLRFRARLKGVHESEIKSRVEEAMEICQLHRRAAKKIIGNLSKGFRQRVGIADAVLSHPEVIIMDEPTIGLDPHQILAIRKLISSLRGKMSVIISSHILPEIEVMCDRVVIINNGKIVASGTPERLRKDFISSERYQMSLRADRERLENLLSTIGEDLEIESASPADENGYRTFVVTAPALSDLGAQLIGELSKDAQLGLRELAHKKPTLEEIFMAATRRSWDENRELSTSQKDSNSSDNFPLERDAPFAETKGEGVSQKNKSENFDSEKSEGVENEKI